MRTVSEFYEGIGEAVKEKFFPELADAKIVYLACDEPKKRGGKITFADCSIVSKRYEWCCDADFIITVYEPNVDYMNREQLEILMEHELMHADFSEGKASIRPHDAEEFKDIIRKYGIDWSQPKG